MSIDISLKDVDINQCDYQASSAVPEMKESGNKQAALNTFLGTHRCKASTRVSKPSLTHSITSHLKRERVSLLRVMHEEETTD